MARTHRVDRLIWIKGWRSQRADTALDYSKEARMAWDANHILWAEQVEILWAVLPPVFVAAGFSIFAAPLIEKRRQEAAKALPPIALETAAAE